MRCTDLKIALMDRIDDSNARARAAAYLGLTLRSARRWLLGTQSDLYGGFRLRWALNIGIPSAGYDDKDVRATFCSVAQAAWRLSLRPGLPTLETATNALRGSECASDSDVPIEVVPEIAAEVVGYARSRRRNDGLHVMIDVGASTIDVCGFVLHTHDGDDCYRLLTALVERIGVRKLHLQRMAEIERAGARMTSCVPTDLGPFAAVPDAGSEYVGNPSDPLREKLKQIDKNYVQDCTKAIMTVLMKLRKSRDPKSPNWESGLPVFVGGGGSQFGLVRKAMEQADDRLRRSIVPQGGIDRRPLATLETLTNEDITDDLAGRLDVAYGLSFDKFDIGTITPSQDTKDIPSMPQRPRQEAISKDQV